MPKKTNGTKIETKAENGKNQKPADNIISEKKAQMTASYNIPAEPQKVVRLAVTESEDPNHDAHLLREVIGVLLEYPGRDRVNLDIRTGERLVRMDLPVVSTGYCEGLHSRLEEILGSDTVTVHQELGLGMEPLEEKPITMPLETAPQPVSEPEPLPSTVVEELPSEVAESQIPISVADEVPAAVGAEAPRDEPPF
jgi:hypothetical protein